MNGELGWLAPLMFGTLFLLLLTGYPVAFVLGAVGLIFGVIGYALGVIPPELMQAVPERLFGIMRNDTLLSIPFFTLMGLILERSGLAEDLLETVGRLFGRLRGGLALPLGIVAALKAKSRWDAALTAVALLGISIPSMCLGPLLLYLFFVQLPWFPGPSSEDSGGLRGRTPPRR